MIRPGPRAGVAIAIACVAVAGCTATVSGSGSAASRSGPMSSPTSSATGTPATGDCPATYAAPDPNRPRVSLTFVVSRDLTSVDGREHIVFVPDRPITELVFRLTANTAPSVDEGNAIKVTKAVADHGAGPATYTRAGAASASQGGLLHIPFPSQVAAGTTVTADLDFTVTLGDQSFDRFGRTDSGDKRFAWFASAHPLLAWERGFGWHTEDMLQFTAESATSEAMDTDLTVEAPSAMTVIASGDPTPSAETTTQLRSWHSHLAAARDVSVAVGPFADSRVSVGSTTLHLGAFSAAERDRLIPEFRRAITELSKRFGPFPFPSLSVARLPANGGGIEYPGSILMLDGSRLVSVHETAHQWFYAMVGDSQALHAWLDEAFATYAEELVNEDGGHPQDLRVPGAVDRSTESYGSDVNDYYFITYSKGSAALLAARDAAGAAKWDAALRCYINKNAWRIANPNDLRAAMAKLPAAVHVLEQAGALH